MTAGMAKRRIVIAGGGLAAARAAERLAERGYAGRLDIVCAEPHQPYRRPALSEGVLTGHRGARDLRIDVPVPRLTRWIHGVRAVGLDRRTQRIHLSDGRALPYDGLIIASGVRARALPLVDHLDPTLVHSLRTIDDALRLRRVVRRARHVLVVGGGLIGTEAAASLAACGVGVTVVEPAPELLAAQVGSHMGAAITALHRRHGVDVRTGAGIVTIDESGRGVVATLNDGTVVRADAVVVAIGSLPETEWLEGSGVVVDGGVVCEPTLHASADDIVACGDCARWPNLRFGGASRRVEQWVTATLMAQHAADALLDGRAAATAFTPVPWGWTEQWGVRIHMVGVPGPAAEHRIDEGDPQSLRGAFTLHDEDGRLSGVLAADRPAATLRLSRALAEAWPEPSANAAQRWRETTLAVPTGPEHEGAWAEAPLSMRRFARVTKRVGRRPGNDHASPADGAAVGAAEAAVPTGA